MGLADRVPGRGGSQQANNVDPRDESSADVIDLASRTAYPTVTQRKGKSDTLALVAGIGVVGALGIAVLWGMDTARQVQQPVTPPLAVEPEPVAALPQPAPQPDPAALPQPDPAPQPVLANNPNNRPVSAANPYATPTIVFDSSTLPAPEAAAPGDAIAADAKPSGVGGAAGDFASRIGGVGGAPARAAVAIDPATTVTQGTMIPAILETAIDTDVPGYVRAVVSQDVRSFDGTRVLVPRSSRLIGQYQSGLQAGQKRAYVIWTRLIRPDGVSVDIASPATDFAGQTGLPGKVNSHFFKRFGSAMLLSVIGGLTAVASGGTAVVLGGGQSAASTALQQDGQIAPTVRVRQGEPIRVFTARDLDFSRVATQ